MINTKSVTLFMLLLATQISGQAWAKTYRCKGRVQRYPCSVKQQVISGAALAQNKLSKEKLELAVSQEALKRLPQNQGLWLGRVQGNGLIKLELQIFRAGNLESTRKMGEVYLADKSTAFNFKSSLPPGADWSWKIRAFNG